ncbi:MAG: Cysteine-rich secretory protein family protein [bacterium ADurb.Bin400]|nr:MAG: Cysteine-rich secretory protein family protein [bacterium ADurb.Bin400]
MKFFNRTNVIVLSLVAIGSITMGVGAADAYMENSKTMESVEQRRQQRNEYLEVFSRYWEVRHKIIRYKIEGVDVSSAKAMRKEIKEALYQQRDLNRARALIAETDALLDKLKLEAPELVTKGPDREVEPPVAVPKKDDVATKPTPKQKVPVKPVLIKKPVTEPVAPTTPTKPAPQTPPKEPTQPSPVVQPPSSGITVSGVVSAINAQRRANGLQEVSVNNLLNQAAYDKSKHMSDNRYFAHTAPDGTPDWFFVKQVGYRYSAAGANLATGSFGTSQGLVDAWMNSPGHRQNILADFGVEVGVGFYNGYYTMFITKPL